jgi:hypothetical protein
MTTRCRGRAAGDVVAVVHGLDAFLKIEVRRFGLGFHPSRVERETNACCFGHRQHR